MLSFCQVHIIAFHFQPECYRNWSLSFLVHLVSTGVLACTSRPLFSSFIALQTPKLTWCSLFLFSIGVVIFFSFVKLLFRCFSTYKVLVMVLVPLAERSVLNFVHLRCVISFDLFNLARFFGFTRLSKKQFVLPLHLPLLFGAILDLGTRSSCSGGML